MINVVRGITSVKFETRVCNLVGRVQVASIWCDVITCAVPSNMINKCYYTHRNCEVSVLLEVEESELLVGTGSASIWCVVILGSVLRDVSTV